METPTYNAEGMAIYKPQPGEHWKGGLRFRESYGGIIAEIQDLIVEKHTIPLKTYPQNFAGIIAALDDLSDITASEQLPSVGSYPPGWEIIKDDDGNIIGGDWQVDPKDGELWFDKRQGRLFIAIDGQYWQTNGGDGIAQVGDTVPTNPPVIGSTWFDTVNDVLYVFVGNDLWQAVRGAGEVVLTTATLPLSITRSTFAAYTPNIIPAPDPATMQVQKDYNQWLMSALTALDQAATASTVSISDTPPTDNLVNGTLWYDSSSLELSIWYEDDDTGQWVPTAVSYPYDDDLAIIRASVVAETTAREYAVVQLLQEIEGLRQTGVVDVNALEAKVAALEDHVENHPVEVDLTGYTTNTALSSAISTVTESINSVQALLPDLTSYATKNEVNNVVTAIGLLPNKEYVNSAIATAAPDLSSFVNQADIDTSISNITTEYLPRTGGTLSGSFVVQKEDAAYPAFDFSSAVWYGNTTHKYRTNSSAKNYTTFGTNEKPWEYAWDFSSEEDFCWVFNDNNKVFSITKDGPACSQLYIGDFGPNTEQGREVRNKIDVKDRLTKYQLAFNEMRQGVANATDFDELKANILTALANV